MKKTLRAVIAIAIVLAFAMPAFAADFEYADLGYGKIISDYCVYTNPFFEQDDFGVELQSIIDETDFSDAPQYTAASYENLIDVAKDALSRRVEKFVITVRTATPSEPYSLDSIKSDLYAHCGVPKYGDYLQWNSSSFYLGYTSNRYVTKYQFVAVFLSNTAQEEAVDARIPIVMDSLELDGKDEYERIKAIYDYICSNVKYDFEHLYNSSYTLKHSTYAALIQGKAVCQGYATLFYRMCLEAGIDARVIVGNAGSEKHAWNIVRLGKYYYYIDSTWDAGYNDYCYFLKGGVFNEHDPEYEYTTAKFQADYPIAKNDYIAGQGDIDYKLTDDGKTLIVFGNGNMADSPDVTQPWYYEVGNVNKLIVEDGVTNVACSAFMNGWMETADIADSVSYIGDNAFANCSRLCGVSLGNGLKKIGSKAFKNCISLRKIVVPPSVTEIAPDAFSGIAGLRLWGYKGTYAEQYARANNIMFVPLVDFDGDNNTGNYETDIIISIIKGVPIVADKDIHIVEQNADVNGDGFLDIRDFNYLYNAIYK